MACRQSPGSRRPSTQSGLPLSGIGHQSSTRDDELAVAMAANARLGKLEIACEQANAIASRDEPDIRSLAQAGRILELGGAWRDAARLYHRFAALAPPLLYPRYRLCHVLVKAGAAEGSELDQTLAELDAAAPLNTRVAILKKMLAMPGAAPPIEGVSQGLWRRWFLGKADWHEGRSVNRADMAVVVIGFRAQAGLLAAVRSLLEQDVKAEIVVVNSGGGNAYAVLAQYAEHIRIIDIEQPLYAGAARNVGIDASAAPHVAFLAGDCIARSGWIGLRLARHLRDTGAVASAIAFDRDDSDLALAAHVSLFGARSPGVPPQQALRYGVSYARQVFREFGYFNPALRISEDTDFAKRTARRIHPAWDPQIQTEHRPPRTALQFVLEMYGRGKRAARHQPPGAKPPPSLTVRGMLASTRQRAGIAERIAIEHLKIDGKRLAGIRRYLWPATLAYGIGKFVASLERHKAMRHHAKSIALKWRAATALRHAETAVRKDPDNLEFLLNAVDLADLAEFDASVHLDTATRIAGFQEQGLLRLSRWLIQRGRHERAWLLGESATIDLPQAAEIHRTLALAAWDAGDAAAFELAALDALARIPGADELWARLQRRL